jgi:hypothetical protein
MNREDERTKMPTKQLPSTLSGVAGEYFVAAELSRRGYIASITLRNTKGIDILASNQEASKSVGIQVKTSQNSNKEWILSKGAEDYFNDNLFYVFVELKGEKSRPNFHIVPSETIARRAKEEYDEWIALPKSNGEPRKETTMRWFVDYEDEFLEKWELLGLDKTPSEKYQAFFDRLRTKVLNIDAKFTRAKAPAETYWNLGIGKGGLTLYAGFSASDGKFNIGIWINVGDREANEDAFAKLRESKSRIEEEIGEELVWDSQPDLKSCSIYLPIDGTIDDNEQRHSELIEWAAPMLIKFREIFEPLVKSI